jgi:ABC-type branched-subunit amino acid transport system substrate-binding protein
MQAAVDAINKAGGVDGHPLVLKFCDNDYDANLEIACMRELIGDKVSAVIDPEILVDSSGAEYKLAQEAKIPIVGGNGYTPAELSSPAVYMLTSGVPGWAYGTLYSLKAAGATKIAIVGDNHPSSSFFQSLSAAAFKDAGLKPVRTVIADITADPTLSAAAAKAVAGGVNGVILGGNPSETTKEVVALRQLGYKGVIITLSADLTPVTVKSFGSMGNGVLVSSQVAFATDTSNPDVAAAEKDMRQYAPGAVIDASALQCWASVEFFAKLMAGASSFTPSAVTQRLNSLSTPIDVGITGPVSFKGKKALVAAFPRTFVPWIVTGKIENGVIVADGSGFADPFSSLRK